MMRKLGWAAAVVLAVGLAFGCGGKKQEEEPATEEAEETEGEPAPKPACKVDDDCFASEICLDGECTSTARGGVYSNPRKAVTPAKVKREVEKRMEQGAERIDRGMNMGEE